MAARSAGILLFRRDADATRVLLVHPGGPFWAKRDAGAWTIPKGEIGADEDPAAAARREFAEELGRLPPGALHALGDVVQKAGKRVIAFALEGDYDVAQLVSNTFEMEWPPRSGKRATFAEVDRAAWFDFAQAREKILPAQVPLLQRLEAALRAA